MQILGEERADRGRADGQREHCCNACRSSSLSSQVSRGSHFFPRRRSNLLNSSPFSDLCKDSVGRKECFQFQARAEMWPSVIRAQKKCMQCPTCLKLECCALSLKYLEGGGGAEKEKKEKAAKQSKWEGENGRRGKIGRGSAPPRNPARMIYLITRVRRARSIKCYKEGRRWMAFMPLQAFRLQPRLHTVRQSSIWDLAREGRPSKFQPIWPSLL